MRGAMVKMVYVKLNETVHDAVLLVITKGAKNINGNALFYEAAELFHI